MKILKLLSLLLAVSLFSCGEEEITPDGMHFDFGSGKVQNGYIGIDANTRYVDTLGYGITPYVKVEAFGDVKTRDSKADGLHSAGAFYFEKNVEEGAYKVTITLGSNDTETDVTIKGESRRLFVHDLKLKKGEFKTVTFIVDAFTTSVIGNDRDVGLKEREGPSLKWDNKLSIEFNGKSVNVSSLVLEKVEGLPKVFIAGDSTVTDQDSEPWASWGQMFPFFLKNNIVVSNYAVSGSTLRHYRASRRLGKALGEMKKGDFMIIEFTHNDQKQKDYDPFVGFTEDLKDYCDKIIAKGGQPIIITATMRRRFDEEGKIVNTLGDFPEAMRKYAKENSIPLVDLNKMSAQLFEALGVEDSKKAFVHYKIGSFPGVDRDLADNTHFNAYGAFELAKCIVNSMQEQNLEIANYIKDDFKGYDPNNPDNPDTFVWPLSPAVSVVKPYGN
ncbi:MAG: rhamnogalacturonan acetylesterase [Mangrovibacterium sp.]